MKDYGEHALLIEAQDAEHAQQLATAIRAADIHHVRDVVPADGTVVVSAAIVTDDLRRRLAALQASPENSIARTHVIPVVYDGADLDDVAQQTGLSVDEIVRRHTAANYRVAFLGFVPGFGYLTGLDQALRLHRHATPRAKVPGGSVAIAGDYAAVYPVASPGGWWLLGRTSTVLFDPASDPPARFAPGDTVRFTTA